MCDRNVADLSRYPLRLQFIGRHTDNLMTTTRPAIAVACICMFCVAPSVCGQNLYFNQVSYSVSEEIATGPYPSRERFDFRDVATTLITSDVEKFAAAGIDHTLEFRNVTANVTIQGRAEIGALRASLQGNVFNDTSSPIHAYVAGSVQALWQDTWVVNVPGLAPGSLVRMNGALKLTGSLGTTATAQNTTGSWRGRTTLGLTLAGPILPSPLRFSLPPPIYGGRYFAYSSSDSGSPEIQIPHPALIPVDVVVRNGEALTYQIKIGLSGEAYAYDSFPTGPGFASAFFAGDYSNTLAWNGITSVANFVTGQPIVDWTVSSASGFDYSQPYRGVPEPSSLILLSVGLSSCWGWRRR